MQLLTPPGWRVKHLRPETTPYIPKRPAPKRRPGESKPERLARLAVADVRRLQHFVDLAFLNRYADPDAFGNALEVALDQLDDRLVDLLGEVRHG